MAVALEDNSSSSEGWLTFFSASARGSLSALSTVKPKRIYPFIWSNPSEQDCKTSDKAKETDENGEDNEDDDGSVNMEVIGEVTSY